MIAVELLEKYGAVKKSFDKNDIIFEEGNLPLHYYQILSGEVKMSKLVFIGIDLPKDILLQGLEQCLV